LITPQHHRLRDLPFAFAYELLIPHRTATVIDHAAAITNLRGTVLPEIIAHTRPTTPVITQQNGTRQLFCPRQKGRKTGGVIFGSCAKGGGCVHAAA
jgi:hypothetical protein